MLNWITAVNTGTNFYHFRKRGIHNLLNSCKLQGILLSLFSSACEYAHALIETKLINIKAKERLDSDILKFDTVLLVESSMAVKVILYKILL